MLLPRILTAVFGIPFFMYMIHLGSLPYALFVIALAVLALYEYALILWMGGRGVQKCVTIVGGAAMACAVALDGAGHHAAGGMGLTHFVVTAVLAAALLSELLRKEHSLDRAAVTVFGSLLIGWTLGHLVLIRDLRPNGEALTYLLFVSVWATDTCAYCAGSAVGTRRLSKVVSPKKTWEGAAGGLVGAVAVVLLARTFFMSEVFTLPVAVSLGILIGVLGQLSDLGQSLVKRASGAKDSSSLLPGHGGVFDRMDSLLLLSPVFYYVLLIAGL